jgi:ABC-type amino acid transport substrate-binding protein
MGVGRPDQPRTAGFLRTLLVHVCVGLLSLFGSFGTQAASPGIAAEPAAPALTVGVFEAPPFAFRSPDGEWRGIAVRLLDQLEHDLGVAVTLREAVLAEAAAELAAGTIDAALVIPPTAEGERLMDFSQPYYSTRLGIAVPTEPFATDWSGVFDAFLSWAFLKGLLALLALLLIAAVALWLCERRSNDEHFRPDAGRGITDGLWWAAVTMTTVGYGDKTAKTQLGRAIAGIWMFAAIIAISLFTAQVASLLTLRSLAGRVHGPADLPNVQVGTLAGSAAEAELRRWLGVSGRGYARFEEGLQALLDGEIDAFVAADPILRYEAINRFPGRISVLHTAFGHEDFALGLPLGSPYRKRINESVLRLVDSQEWPAVLREYLGDDR